MEGIDLRMKEMGVRHFGKDFMNKLTDEEIIQARCDTMKYLGDLVTIGLDLQKGDLEYAFCEIFVKDIIARKEVNLWTN